MKVKITITTAEAIELIVKSEFHRDDRADGMVAFNGDWTITQKDAIFMFKHEWSTEGPQIFELSVPY